MTLELLKKDLSDTLGYLNQANNDLSIILDDISPEYMDTKGEDPDPFKPQGIMEELSDLSLKIRGQKNRYQTLVNRFSNIVYEPKDEQPERMTINDWTKTSTGANSLVIDERALRGQQTQRTY